MLYVTRHGETTWNKEGLVCGRADVPLTKKGYQQAETLAKKVSELEIPITKILHSPLQRAKETARIVSEHNDLPMTSDARLVEMDFGRFDGTPANEPEFQFYRKQMAQRFPDGESYFDMYHRVVPLIEECLADKNETYLLVCHNALIRTLHCYFKPLTNDEFVTFFVENTELMTYE